MKDNSKTNYGLFNRKSSHQEDDVSDSFGQKSKNEETKGDLSDHSSAHKKVDLAAEDDQGQPPLFQGTTGETGQTPLHETILAQSVLIQ